MSRFSELSEHKTLILKKLITSPEIVKCLVNNENNFLSIPLPVDFDTLSLIYNQIYPWRFVPKVETEPNTYITMKLSYRPNGNLFKIGSIYFYIITHNSLIRTDEDVLRCDFLVSKIDELFNLSDELGFDELSFNDMDEFIVNENYSGVYISYKLQELQ